MKLSEIKSDRACEVLCEIAPYIANIVKDEIFLATLRNKVDLGESASRAEILAAGLDKLTELMPILIKAHRNDVYGILAAVNDEPVEGYAEKPFGETVRQVYDLLSDKMFTDFFS